MCRLKMSHRCLADLGTKNYVVNSAYHTCMSLVYLHVGPPLIMQWRHAFKCWGGKLQFFDRPLQIFDTIDERLKV